MREEGALLPLERSVLHLAPHPDDEAIGAPATLLGLARNGWRVVNIAISLGRPHQQDRRKAELEEACERLGIDLVCLSPPAAISSGDDLRRARNYVAGATEEIVSNFNASLIISPSPHDRHHGHIVVGRATQDLVSRHPVLTWWMWGLWADLPFPSIFSPFDHPQLLVCLSALEAHEGELKRNDYRRMLRARAEMNSILGAERVFGFGSPSPSDKPYAELLTECTVVDGRWMLGKPRMLDYENPIPGLQSDRDITQWVVGSQSQTEAD